MQSVTRLMYAAQYTGSGSSTTDVVAAINTEIYLGSRTVSVVSDTGTHLQVHVAGPDTTDYNVDLNVGDWVVWSTYGPVDYGLSNSQYVGKYSLWSSVIGSNATGVVATKSKYGGYGQSILGSLVVGSTNIAVTIKPAQPDTGYVASAFIDGPALALGTVTVGTPVKTSASVVTVPITNTGLLTLTLTQSVVSVNVTSPQS